MISCKICGAQVPPEWKFAINNNTCPGCGEPLLDEESKELLDELRNAMKEMPNDPEGVAGWLLSNYKIVKIGEAQPVNFYGRKLTSQPDQQQSNQSSSSELPSDFKVRESPINKFLKNAGMQKLIGKQPLKNTNPKKLADIVDHIHNNIESDETITDSDDYPEELYEVYEDYEGGDSNEASMPRVAQMLANHSSLDVEDSSPPTDTEKAALISALGGPSQPAGENIHPALAKDREMRQNISSNVASGVGKIKRRG